MDTMPDTAPAAAHQYVRKRVASLRPSPENTKIYRPDDPDIDALARAIKKNGCDPLVITRDKYIVSGHRRYEAMRRIGQVFCMCKVLPFRRGDKTADEFTVLIREYNHQRNKTVAERVNEALVDIDPTAAHRRLIDRRVESVYAADFNGFETLRVEGSKRRYNISAVKAEHVAHIKKVVFETHKQYWPLTVRGVHYPLLNYDFFRNTRLGIRYLNDPKSYYATSNLITRLRLTGVIPWEAFDDPTRPYKDFRAFTDAREFVTQELGGLFGGYWRDYLQSQPNRVEVVCEKNTIYPLVCRVTKKYQIPTSSGRGFSSIDAWHKLYRRFCRSGKQRLIVIVVSDYDPEGEWIPHVGGRTLHEFGLKSKVDIIKAGVTREQIERYNLPAQKFAKEKKSKLKPWFRDRNGGDETVYEVEALDPQHMMNDLDEVIRGVIDVDLFNGEVETEREEAAYLEACRRAAAEALKGLDV
jgi:hypothetical protein